MYDMICDTHMKWHIVKNMNTSEQSIVLTMDNKYQAKDMCERLNTPVIIHNKLDYEEIRARRDNMSSPGDKLYED